MISKQEYVLEIMEIAHTKYTLNAQKIKHHKNKKAYPLPKEQPIYKTNQRQNVILYHKIIQKNNNLMAWLAHSTLLNALPFLSFHKAHIRHKGQPFFYIHDEIRQPPNDMRYTYIHIARTINLFI